MRLLSQSMEVASVIEAFDKKKRLLKWQGQVPALADNKYLSAFCLFPFSYTFVNIVLGLRSL
jgi:hypothetical protein